MSGPEAQTGPEAPEAPREQLTLDQALQEYGQQYQRFSERIRTQEELAELDVKVRGIIIPENRRNDADFLRSQQILASEEMDAIRAQTVDAIMRELEELPRDLTREQRSKAAAVEVQKVSEISGFPDLIVMRDVASRLIEMEERISREAAEQEQNPEQRKRLLQDAEKLAEARRQMTFPSGQNIQVQDLVISEEADEHWVRGALALPHQILEGLNYAGDKLGNVLGTPRSFRDLNAASMLVGAGKLTLAIAAILNLAGLGVAQWNTASNLFRNILAGNGGKAIEEIPNFFKNIVTVLPSSIVTSGAAIYLATRDGDLTDLDPYISRAWQTVRGGVNYAASNEYFASAAGGVRSAVEWVQETAGPLLEMGKEGFNKYVIQYGSEMYAKLKSGANEEWNALGLWAKGVGVDLNDYQKHFETMGDFQDEIDRYFEQSGFPDVSPRTVSVSTEKFNQFLTRYIQGNENKNLPEIKKVPLTEMMEMGFITETEKNHIPTDAPAFLPSQELAKKFIEQGLWWRAQSTVTN